MQKLKAPFALSAKAYFADNNHRIINYHIRFIEMMPVGVNNAWTAERFLSIKKILSMIRSLGTIRPLVSKPLDGPAQRYALEGAEGEIGVIGAMSSIFVKDVIDFV